MSVKYELLPHQKEFIEMPTHDYEIDISLYQGGYGSGKTFSGSLLGTLLCLKYAGIRGLVGAQTLALVRDTTLVTYKEHFDKMGLTEGTDWKELKAESKIVFSNGSEILFRHLDEPEKLKSLNLGFVEIEEMSDTPQGTFDMLLSRLRQAKRDEWGDTFKYRLFGHTNPEKAKGWIYKYFVEDVKPNYRRIIAPTTENKFLPKGFVEMLRERYDDDYFNVNVLGLDGDYVSGLATKGFNRYDNVTDSIKPNKNYPIHICCDFNTDPMCWYIAQKYDGTCYILYELVECFTETLHCARILSELLKAEGFQHHEIIINGDASGNSNTTTGTNFKVLRTVLLDEGFSNLKDEVVRKNPAISYRLNCWNNMIRDKHNVPHILIHPQCKWLIYDIENLEMEAGGNKPKKISSGKLKSDPYAKYLTHPIDACSYFVMRYFPIQEEVRYDQWQGEYKSVWSENKYEFGR